MFVILQTFIKLLPIYPTHSIQGPRSWKNLRWPTMESSTRRLSERSVSPTDSTLLTPSSIFLDPGVTDEASLAIWNLHIPSPSSMKRSMLKRLKTIYNTHLLPLPPDPHHGFESYDIPSFVKSSSPPLTLSSLASRTWWVVNGLRRPMRPSS